LPRFAAPTGVGQAFDASTLEWGLMANLFEATKDGDERGLRDWRTPTVTELGEVADAEFTPDTVDAFSDGGVAPNCS
jgi:hypothetical protein